MCVDVGVERADVFLSDNRSKVCPGSLKVRLAQVVPRCTGLRERNGRVRVEFSGAQCAQVVGAKCTGDEHCCDRIVSAPFIVSNQGSESFWHTECDAPSSRARSALSFRRKLGALLLLTRDTRRYTLKHLTLEGRAVLFLVCIASYALSRPQRSAPSRSSRCCAPWRSSQVSKGRLTLSRQKA